MQLPNLVGLIGQFGSGKSLAMVELGLQIADKYRKPLVANFPLSQKKCREYCAANNLRWFAGNGRVISVELDLQRPDSLMLLFSRPGSVVLFDEAGVFANSRKWEKLPKEFGRNLFQIRHLDIHMILAFQFLDQIDKFFRETIQYWVWCKGLSVYSRRLKAPCLHFRFLYHYDLERFLMLADSPELRSKWITTWRTAKRVQYSCLPFNYVIAEFRNLVLGLLWLWKNRSNTVALRRGCSQLRPYREQQLFNCYSSIHVLGQKLSKVRGSKRPIFVSDAWDRAAARQLVDSVF